MNAAQCENWLLTFCCCLEGEFAKPPTQQRSCEASPSCFEVCIPHELITQISKEEGLQVPAISILLTDSEHLKAHALNQCLARLSHLLVKGADDACLYYMTLVSCHLPWMMLH